jgi:hypothetical protein
MDQCARSTPLAPTGNATEGPVVLMHIARRSRHRAFQRRRRPPGLPRRFRRCRLKPLDFEQNSGGVKQEIAAVPQIAVLALRIAPRLVLKKLATYCVGGRHDDYVIEPEEREARSQGSGAISTSCGLSASFSTIHPDRAGVPRRNLVELETAVVQRRQTS